MGRMWCWLLLVVTLPALAVDYPPVRPGRSVSLPADTGAHPGYRTEWWYVTGWLDDEAGGNGVSRSPSSGCARVSASRRRGDSVLRS